MNKNGMNMKSIFCIILMFFIFFTSCQTETEKATAKAQAPVIVLRDLETILEEGKLKVLTIYSSTSYFLYRGQPMGFEYELLERFADYLGVELEISVSKNIDHLMIELNAGHTDLIAHGLTITSERKKTVSFTDHLYLTHQVLVQKKPDSWRTMKWSKLESSLIHDAIDLIGDTVSVRQNSSYFHRLNNLSKEIGGRIIIDTLSGDISTDKIIKMVVDEKIKFTVADNNIANINASYYSILNIDVPISFSQRIAWAVRFNSPNLADAANKWIKEIKKETDYYVIYNKYFKNKRSFRKRIQSDFYSLNNNKISKYDDLIKKYAKEIGWDWRLLASLIYQESRFETKADSWAGANGLMQLMPATAKELGVKNRLDPKQNIRGGTKYLKQLENRFKTVEDPVQRLKITMASYNCGYSHVVDAQNLAESKGLQRNMWDENLDKMILELSFPENYNNPIIKYGYVRGEEPYNYVEQIFKRYEHYKQFIEE